ncbi:hypothetical protein EDF87_104160 [Pseudomonas helmanticensis]|uniref:Uncharacterized protein n=1 Tax=Pseudomonas helmanticensis TaxID=1471381 RepID=A0A4R7VJA2_9PSED|nr:hypothetical protein EDF87_104160 [Pseudomonas helmanticensis]
MTAPHPVKRRVFYNGTFTPRLSEPTRNVTCHAEDETLNSAVILY